jgi:hypothetical protein
MPLPPQCSTLYDLLTGGYKKLEETHLDIQISDLNQANLARGQECVFLEFGESSALAYLKPMYGENMAEASFQLDTTMIEAATFPALSRPPTPGQVVSAPRSFNSYVKYIRSEKIKIRTGYFSKHELCGSSFKDSYLVRIQPFPKERVKCFKEFCLQTEME